MRGGARQLGDAAALLNLGERVVCNRGVCGDGPHVGRTKHVVFPEDSLAKIQKSGLISKLACTASHPRARELASDYLRVESLGALFAEKL